MCAYMYTHTNWDGSAGVRFGRNSWCQFYLDLRYFGGRRVGGVCFTLLSLAFRTRTLLGIWSQDQGSRGMNLVFLSPVSSPQLHVHGRCSWHLHQVVTLFLGSFQLPQQLQVIGTSYEFVLSACHPIPSGWFLLDHFKFFCKLEC